MSKLEFTRGETIASKYEVIDPLDESPLGFTHRVKHQKSGKFVRLTMLRPKIAGREHKDALLEIYKKVKDLQHASIVKIGELGEHEGIAYFTAEDFEGQTLREVLSEYKVSGQKFELKEAAQITVQILEGLEALHKEGFVIRGLRPEHILINVRRTGPRNKNFVARVKICGSGFWDLVPAASLAEDEFARGEAQYLAPEMKSFEPTSTVRADMYSTGVILYELLTGIAPVGTFQMPATVRPDLPKVVNDIVELALAQSPDDRYQTAADFMTSIQRIIVDSGVDEAEKRPMLTPVGWGLGFILLIAASIILWQLRPDPPDVERDKLIAMDTTLRNEAKQKLVYPPREELEALMKKQPPGMAYIPAGPFISGRLNNDEFALSSEPLAQMMDMKPYLIDIFEYPNQKGAPPEKNVDWKSAKQKCELEGKRLCTAAEWEKACKGPLNSIYAYDRNIPADDFDLDFCGDGLADRGYASGAKEACKSGYGVFDMSGSYREWTATEASGRETRRIVKGGQVRNGERGSRCAFTTDESSAFRDDSISWRCCRDTDAPPWSGAETPPAAPGTVPAGGATPTAPGQR